MTSRLFPSHQSRRPNPVSFSTTNRFADSSDDESETEEERRRKDEEEEEQERLLSEQFGEASEAPSSGAERKRRTSDQDIAAEYADASTQPRKKKSRPTLQVKDVIGSNGLIRIKTEFPRKLRLNTGSSSKSKKHAAALYAQHMIDAYTSFCYDLFPGLAFSDVLTRIDSFGSKKEIKTYLSHMRDEVRNNHVENLFGKEQANKMMQELEDGMRQQDHVDVDGAGAHDFPRHDDAVGTMPTVAEDDSDDDEPVRRISTRASTRIAEEGEEQQSGVPTATTNESSSANKDNAEAEATFQDGEDDLQDTDDELELVAAPKPLFQITATASTNRTDAVLEDTEDELDDEAEMPANQSASNAMNDLVETKSGETKSGQANDNAAVTQEPPVDTTTTTCVKPDLGVTLEESAIEEKSVADPSGDTAATEKETAVDADASKCEQQKSPSSPVSRSDSNKISTDASTPTASVDNTAVGSIPRNLESSGPSGASMGEVGSPEDLDVSPIKDFHLGQETPDHHSNVLLSEDLQAHLTGSDMLMTLDTSSQSDEVATVIPSATMDTQLESPLEEGAPSDVVGNKEISTVFDPSNMQFSPLK